MTVRVVRVEEIVQHPDPETHSLEILRLSNGASVVTGRHYEAGQLGVYVPSGYTIPGWMGEDAWMVKKGMAWIVVEARVMRDVPSPGLFFGQRYRKTPQHDWEPWPMWRPRFVVGEDLTAYLGVRPPRSP